MAKKLVCNINFFYYTRFILGFYYEFQVSKPVQWLAKCYCCLFCSSVIAVNYYLLHGTAYPEIAFYFQSTEYVVNALFSLIKGNEYLIHYYKKNLLIDTNESTYRPLPFCFAGYICIMYFMRILKLIKYILDKIAYPAAFYCFAATDFVMWSIIFIGRLPLALILALLYTRMRFMRETLEGNNFDCRTQGKNHPRWYIRMYEANMGGLEESDKYVKPQTTISVVCSIGYYFVGVMNALYYMKYLSLTFFNIWDFVTLILEVLFGSTPLFLASILGDLISMERQKMLEIATRRRIACKNERDREEIQLLIQFLQNNPFEYNLWRVVHINLRSLLTFSSFAITTIIALLQVQGWVI